MAAMVDSYAPDATGEDLSLTNKSPRRTKFTVKALEMLEGVYARDDTPSTATREALASTLGVTPRNIQIWFQNKRQRHKASGLKRKLSDGPGGPVLVTATPATPQMLTTTPYVRASPDASAQFFIAAQCFNAASSMAMPTALPHVFAPLATASAIAQPSAPFAVPMPLPLASHTTALPPAIPPVAGTPGPAMAPTASSASMRRNATFDSLADLADVAGINELLSHSGSTTDLASLSRSASLGDVASLASLGSMSGSMSGNGSMASKSATDLASLS